MSESDPIPLDGSPELSPAERLVLRRIIRERERMTWARKKLGWILSGVVTFVAATWAAVEWLREHVVIK